MTKRIHCLLYACAFAFAASAQGFELLPQQLQAKAIYHELIEFDTTHSTGQTTAAAQAMAQHLLSAGLPKEDVQVLEQVPGKGNLVARLRSKTGGNRKPILLMGHLDVVEAKREDWSTDPLKFVEKDGFYYARGVMDDKAMAAIFVANLLRYLKEGYQPNRDIILALTADEEGGDHNGMNWLVAKHRDLIDAAFAINEGGYGAISKGKKVFNGVEAAQKIFQSFTLTTVNRGGHSSQPRKDNAIYELSQALMRISQFDFPIKLNVVTRAYFEAMARLESGQEAEDLKSILKSDPPADAVRRLTDRAMYNSMLRTTCVATLIDGGHAPNALPQKAKATINCRLLPDDDSANVLSALKGVVDDANVDIQPVAEARRSPVSPLTPELTGAIRVVTERLWPGIPVIPFMTTGATDAIPLRSNGIPVYGVSGIFDDIDDLRMHGRDERILVQSYFDGLEFSYQLVKKLTQ